MCAFKIGFSAIFLVKTSFCWNPEGEVRVVLKMVKMFENACLKETERKKKCIKTDLSDWKKDMKIYYKSVVDMGWATSIRGGN